MLLTKNSRLRLATHEKALAEAKAFYQSESDKAILEKQVELDNARGEVDAARADAEKARADAQHVRAEFGEYQAQLEAVKVAGEKKVSVVASQMYEAGARRKAKRRR